MSLEPAYFDALYAESTDPWGLGSRAYETRKYNLTIAALPRPRYKRVFEPGCSVGVLTRALAAIGETVIATDVSPAVLDTARHAGVPGNVQLERAAAPRDWPHGSFDLIVFSELGYYFDADDLALFLDRTVASLEDGGHLIAVHWREPVPDYPGTAAEVHEALAASGLLRLASYDDEHFLLDVFGAGEASRLTGPPNEEEEGDDSPSHPASC